MILGGLEIANRVLNGEIYIDNFDEQKLNPNSYNLSLDNKLLVYTDEVLDMKKDNAYEELIIPEEGLVLMPGKLYLGRTKERTITKGLVPMLEGRSSIGRLGLAIHITAGFGDVGFDGYWTLELKVTQPLRIYADTEIAQIYYHTIHGYYNEYSSDKYQNNKDIQTSQLYKEFK